MKPLLALAVLALSLPGAALAQEPAPAEAAALTRAEEAAVDVALARGKLIHALDQAAWHGTDAAVARLGPRQGEVRGYLAEDKGGVQVATFYGLDGAEPYVIFIAEVRDGQVVSSREVKADEPRALTPVQLRMVRARTMVREALAQASIQPCAPASFNTVVIPPESADAPMDIYLLTPQVTVGQFPFGGHYRITLGPDGAIKQVRPFTNSCLTMAASPPLPADKAREGYKVLGIGVSHLLDPTPTEIHAWLARWMAAPVMVMIQQPQQTWEVTSAGMRKLAINPGR